MGKIQWLLGWTSGINDNSKWAIFGKKNSKWAIFGIHKGYIGSIHKYLWYKIIRNTDPMGSHRMRRLYFWLFYIISIYGYSFYTPYIFHIYIYIYIYPGVLRTDRRAGWFLCGGMSDRLRNLWIEWVKITKKKIQLLCDPATVPEHQKNIELNCEVWSEGIAK